MTTQTKHPSALSTASCVTGSLIGLTTDHSTLRIIPLFCHKWSCPRCREAKSNKWRQIAEAGQPDRFITLTLRSSETLSTVFQAHIIKKAFPRLVEEIRKKWGPMEYMLVFELTKQGTPHVHVLQRGGFIPKAWLSTLWNRLTGSFIVDIKKIDNPASVGRYIMKYMGKAIADVHSKLHGMRIIQRSKNWIIPSDKPDIKSTDAVEDQVLSWYFVSVKPAELIEHVRELTGFMLEETESSTSFLMRGPPDENLVDTIMLPLILN